MRRGATAAEMARIEKLAPTGHVSDLMELAGAALAKSAAALASNDGRFAVLCGPGNNGGDGAVAARILSAMGRKVGIAWVGTAKRPPPLEAAHARERLGDLAQNTIDFEPRRGDVAIDALLGVGLRRAPEPLFADAIQRLNGWREGEAMVVSADLPSGLSGDTGEIFSPCVQADLTVTFGRLKPGQMTQPGFDQCGTIELAEIGLEGARDEPQRTHGVWELDETQVRQWLPKRKRNVHKGICGHVLVIAGSKGKAGAATLVGLGALRAGAGLVTIACRPDIVSQVGNNAPELMVEALGISGPLAVSDFEEILALTRGKAAIVIGPGIARSDATGELIKRLLEGVEIPVVIDADALNAIPPSVEIGEGGPRIATPHPGEAGRLLGISALQVNRRRLESAHACAKRLHACALLKGSRTVIASQDGETYINPTGNAGLATAGAGDVLAGITGGLLAQGLAITEASCVAAYVHGASADFAKMRTGELGLVASDILAALGEVWAALDR